MTDYQIRQCKDIIILNVLKFIDNGNNTNKEIAILHLDKMEKYFKSEKLKKGVKKPIKTALFDFISNGQGYLVTIPQLQKSLS